MLEAATYDHYEILTRDDGSLFELGRGGMGVTYKAFDTSLRIPVALKVINGNYLKSELARQRFVREARSAAKLRNRHVASVFHLGAKGDTWFYAMEFIDGATIGALVKRYGPLRPALALTITAQVARALNAAAQHGLVHRDIKPENLMLVEDDDELIAKVIDFGLAKAEVGSEGDGSANLSMGGFVGTAHFASPEQWEEREIDGRSDIYSLGVTLWYMLTGKPPFSGSMPQLMNQHLSKPPPFEKLEKLPASVTEVLKRMLAKDPAERFQTASQLRKAVEAAQESVPETAESLAVSGEALLSPDERAASTAPESASFETNTTIAGRYQVANECGETSAGRLFRAYDTKRKGHVRLLVLRREAQNERIALSVIEREVEKLAKVQHPNLLGVFGFETVDRGSFLVLEWTDGFSLRDLLKARHELNADETVKLLSQAAEGVDHALSVGLNGLDFGLHQIQIHFSQPIEKEKLLRAPLSTWPEFTLKLYPLEATRDLAGSRTWAGERTIVADAEASTITANARAEYVQALAVVAYEALGGTTPPPALRGPGALAARYTPLSTLSEEGNEVLRRALDPARSFPSARDFCTTLGRLEGLQVRRQEPKPGRAGRAVKAPTSPSTTAEGRREKGRPSLFARVLAVGILVSLCVAVYLNSFDEERDDPKGTKTKLEPSEKISPPNSEEVVQKNKQAKPESNPPKPATPALVTPAPTPPRGLLVDDGLSIPAPSIPTRHELFSDTVKEAQEREARGDWAKSLDAWIRASRDFPEFPEGKDNLERLLKQLHDRPSPITSEEFQGMRHLITEAAQLGSLSAMLLLGDNLRKQSPKEAFVWYSEAAANGNAMADALLGFMLSKGEGVNHPDLAKAFEHFKAAADKGNIAAKFALGLCYRSGYGVAKDARHAVRLLREAADAGDARALNELGDCYVHGEGVEKKNLELAFKFFTRAKELGNLDATGNLGLLYLYGEGIAANPKKAAEIFAEGAKAGDSRCMMLYATCLEKGKGVSDALEATSWYRKAAGAGNEEAMEWCHKKKVQF